MGAHAKRIALAILLAPLATGFVILGFAWIAPIAFPDLGYTAALWQLVILFALPISYVATVFLGLPIHFALRRFNKSSIKNHVLIAVSAAAIPSALTLVFEPRRERILYASLFIVCAAAVAVIFALITATGSQSSESTSHDAT